MDDNEQSEAQVDPPRIIPEERIEGYTTDISREPEDLVTEEDVDDVKEMCVCDGRWVENLAAVSTPVRHSHYEHPDNELWLLATWTEIDILFEWRLQGKLWDKDLVRAEDLPEDIDLPEYDRPFNYRYGEISNDQEISSTDTTEEEPANDQ